MLKKTSSFVLVSLRGSTYGNEYASPLRSLILTAVVLALAVGLPQPGLAVDSSSPVTTEQLQGVPKLIDPNMPVYKPRKGSTLRGRVDGGFRGGEEGEPVIKLLAPADHVGETMKKSPALYWYISQPTSYPITFTLEDSRRPQPVLEVPLKSPTCSGVQMIRLADYDKSLEEEVQYWWHISLTIDPKSPSKDIHAKAVIERIPYTEAIFLGRTCKDPRDVFCLYVQSGLWYDAVQVISDLIAASPKDRVLRLQRAALLEQVGLNDVGDWDRMQNGTPCPPSKAELNLLEPTSTAATVRP